MIIDIQAKLELEKRYRKGVQSLCKTLCFSAIDDTSTIDKRLLDEMIEVANAKASLFSNRAFAVGSACHTLSPYLIIIKLITVLVIVG